MPNLLEAIKLYPTANAFRVDHEDEDPLEWECVPLPGDVLVDADQEGYFILAALNIRSTTDVRRCYLDLSTPERINDSVYMLDGDELRYQYTHELEGDCIPAIAIDFFGIYDLFYSKIAPELSIEVLRRGLAVSKRKAAIAEDLGYIFRDEGRYRESAVRFEVAAAEGVSSSYIYKELLAPMERSATQGSRASISRSSNTTTVSGNSTTL
jgi:hypothetical protein